MDANKEAIIERQIAEYRARIDAIIARLPWWARLYIRVISRFTRA
jgi:hypothetical protein